MSGLSFKKDDTPRTYGEKMYSNIFDVGINFGVNLAVSAVFTYWVKHSTRPILKDSKIMKGALNQSPAAFYEHLVKTFQRTPLMKVLKSEEGKRNVAEAMANIFTLNFAGHGILIPSVWLGEKYKTSIIEHFDEKHYGENQPEWVKERHFDIQNAPKTSLAGAVTSRFGTLLATTGTAYALGGKFNILKTVGNKFNITPLKKFEGFDVISGQLGEGTGKALETVLPKSAIGGMNKWARKGGYSHSPEQTAAIEGIGDISQNIKKIDKARQSSSTLSGPHNYNSFIPDVTRFTFLDTLYSAVTALSLGPIMAGVKKLPGMTYKQNSNDEAPQKTMGERVHGAMTYGGVDWLLNAAIGTAFVFAANRTHVGREYYKKPVEWALRKVNGQFIKNNPKLLDKSVAGGQNLVSIAVGGTIINPMLTHLEKPTVKEGIVRSIDETIYGKDTVANDPNFAKAYEAIHNEPDKNMASAWGSRLLALIPIYAVSSNPRLLSFFTKNNVPLLKHTTISKVSNFTKTASERMGMRPQGWWKQTMRNDATGEVTSNWEALHNYAGFDFGLTPYYAILHAATFPMVASVLGGDKEKQNQQQATPKKSDDIVIDINKTKPTNSIREAADISRLEEQQNMQVAH